MFPDHRPDYFVEGTNAWLVYPWEPTEEDLEVNS